MFVYLATEYSRHRKDHKMLEKYIFYANPWYNFVMLITIL